MIKGASEDKKKEIEERAKIQGSIVLSSLLGTFNNSIS